MTSTKSKPFERMVSRLMDLYGMSEDGAEKIVVSTTEAIYTLREQLEYQSRVKEYCKEHSLDEAKRKACQDIVNSSTSWDQVADEIHTYQVTDSTSVLKA